MQVRFLFLCASVVGACTAPQQSPPTSEASPQAPERLTSIEESALDVVRRRTDAYNAHDIDAFIATYAPSVRVYEYPEKFLGEGVERMRKIFGPQFAEGEGRIEVVEQRVVDRVVVSNEYVTFYGKTEHNIGVYTVRNGKIVEVRLIEPD